MSCQSCGSARLLEASAHCSDMFSGSIGGKEISGYVPRDLGIGGGDDMEITLCLDCGQVQGTWPLPRSTHETVAEKRTPSAFAQEVVRAAEDSDVDFSTVLLKLLETGKVEDVVDGLRALEGHSVRSVRNLAGVILSYIEEQNLDTYPAIVKLLGEDK